MLCHGFVHFIFKRDRQRTFRYASLQGEHATQLRAHYSDIPQHVDTVVLIENGRVYLRSTAALRILSALSFPWSALALFRAVPRPIRDWVYDLIAKHRYRLFGRHDMCMLPDIEDRSYFFD